MHFSYQGKMLGSWLHMGTAAVGWHTCSTSSQLYRQIPECTGLELPERGTGNGSTASLLVSIVCIS